MLNQPTNENYFNFKHMKIHITCTEEFANSKLEDVTKILNKVAGEIIFRKNNVLTHSFISLNNSKFTNPESYFSLVSMNFSIYVISIASYQIKTPKIKFHLKIM